MREKVQKEKIMLRLEASLAVLLGGGINVNKHYVVGSDGTRYI